MKEHDWVLEIISPSSVRKDSVHCGNGVIVGHSGILARGTREGAKLF